MFLILLQNEVFFPQIFLKRSHTLHARTHMCTHFYYKSHHMEHMQGRLT